jgi:amidase
VAKSQWSFKTAVELSAALKAKQVSAVELAQDAIGRIERHDGKVNAICVRDFERGLAAARAADEAIAHGEHRPLLGIPVTVKESYNIAGLPTTWGHVAHKDFTPSEDALPVTRVKDAGGVILGKTNVPVSLADWQSYNDVYGSTNNPYDLGRTPGGSSGGSAAALATGYGPLSLGSDIGGSLRVPAFHCGVYAHKPTFDLLASRGHTPPPRRRRHRPPAGRSRRGTTAASAYRAARTPRNPAAAGSNAISSRRPCRGGWRACRCCREPPCRSATPDRCR